jgi:hypothetical protein
MLKEDGLVSGVPDGNSGIVKQVQIEEKGGTKAKREVGPARDIAGKVRNAA